MRGIAKSAKYLATYRILALSVPYGQEAESCGQSLDGNQTNNELYGHESCLWAPASRRMLQQVIPLYIIGGKMTLTVTFFLKNKMVVLLNSGFAYGCYVTANVIVTSCLFSACWIVYLKAIFIINIQYDILLTFFPELQVLCDLHCCIIFVMSGFRKFNVICCA